MALDEPRPTATKASFAIAAEFRERIVRGELRNGDPLPVEGQLVEDLGVSKGTVREALRILEMQGLIETRRGVGGGPRVRHPSLSETAIPMGVYLQIGDVEVMDVWEARDRIIGGAVERLASLLSRSGDGADERAGSDVEELARLVDTLGATVGRLDDYYPLLIEVGETAVRIAGNLTEHVLVRALRYIIATELERATRSVTDVEEAVAIELDIATAWTEVIDHVRKGRPPAARAAFDRQAALIRDGVATLATGRTLVELFPTPEP